MKVFVVIQLFVYFLKLIVRNWPTDDNNWSKLSKNSQKRTIICQKWPKLVQNRIKIGPKSDQNRSKIAFLNLLLHPDHFDMHIRAFWYQNRKTGFIRRTVGPRAKITPFLNFWGLCRWKNIKKLNKTRICVWKLVFCHSFLS